MTNGDKFKVSLDSKVFDKTGKHIYISRKYASFDRPEPESENIKLLRLTEGSFNGGLSEDAFRNIESYGKKFSYTPVLQINKPKIEEKYTQMGYRKKTGYLMDTGLYYEYIGSGDRKAIKKEVEDYIESISAKYFIEDELRCEITTENLDKFFNPSKKILEYLTRQQIADWYLHEISESFKANTEQKKETAIRKRRTDILKFLPVDKPIKDLIGSSAFKEGKKDLSARIKRKQELDRGPKIPMKIDYFSIIGWGVILLIIFWFALGDLDGPKSDCEKAFEYHKDYQVLDQCRRNTIIKDMYDN